MKTTSVKQERARLPGIKCPHCQSKTIVRDSQQITDSVRELRLVCTDDDCGFSAVAQLSFIRQIRQSARPNPEIRLPFGAWSLKPANDDHPRPANDDGIGLALAALMST